MLSQTDAALAFIQNIGPFPLLVILVIMLIVFGRRLPDVARNMGKGIVEFKKGLRGVEDDVEKAASESDSKKDYENHG